MCYNGFILAKEAKLMKKCNVCGCIVDEKSECPICQNTLTYEPPCMEDKEHFVFNKYYYVYLLKNTWFAVLCTIASIIILIIDTPTSSYSLRFILPAIVLLIASLIDSFFKRCQYRRLLKIYSERWANYMIEYDKYFYGAAAVILFLIAGMMK